jgi:hypothetical protein
VVEDGMPADLSAACGSLGEGGIATMSAKVQEMGEQVRVEAEKVKESNRIL